MWRFSLLKLHLGPLDKLSNNIGVLRPSKSSLSEMVGKGSRSSGNVKTKIGFPTRCPKLGKFLTVASFALPTLGTKMATPARPSTFQARAWCL